MRLSHLRASGFRAFPAAIDVRLDADVIVLSGPNGQGKTSMLDAILWGLTGRVSRLGDSADEVVSLYSRTGEAEVEIELTAPSGPLLIRRAWDGARERLHLLHADTSYSDREAAAELSRVLQVEEPPVDGAGLSAAGLHTVITRAIYLQQDLVRAFLKDDDESARFEHLSQLFGTRRIVDLQVELERQKANWSRSVNKDSSQLGAADKEIRRLDMEIENETDSP